MQHVLIISDPIPVQKKCARVLTNEGYHVSIAQRPDVLESCIKEFHPDVVLLDRLYGSFDAFALLLLEVRQKYPEIPAIFICQSVFDIYCLIQLIPCALREKRLKVGAR